MASLVCQYEIVELYRRVVCVCLTTAQKKHDCSRVLCNVYKFCEMINEIVDLRRSVLFMTSA